MSSASATVSATATATATRISIRLMTGDVLEVSVPPNVSYNVLYELVRKALPLEIRPFTTDKMNLMCGEELVPIGWEEAVLDQEGSYLLLIDAYDSHVQITAYNNMDIWDRDPQYGEGAYIECHEYVSVQMECSCGYEANQSFVEWYLYHRSTQTFLDITDVLTKCKGRRENVDDEGSLYFSIPRERHHLSLQEMETVLLRRMEEKCQPSLAGLRVLSHRLHEGLEKIVRARYGDGDSDDEDLL